MKNIYKYLYFTIIIILFLSVKPIINLLTINDSNKVINTILELENKDLKEEIYMLSNIKYNDYNYILAKISIRNLYDSNLYYLESNESIIDDLAVINNNGIIGITKDSTMIGIKDISLSIKVNNKYGMYENGILYMNEECNIGDIVYTSGLTSIPSNLKVGVISSVKLNNGTWECNVILNEIDSSYVGVLI